MKKKMKKLKKSLAFVLVILMVLTLNTVVFQASFLTVSFESNGGSAVAGVSLEVGELITKPADPTKAEATFGGWYTDSGLNGAWNFAERTVEYTDLILGDGSIGDAITLYAKWLAGARASWTVTFQANDGSATADQSVLDADFVVRPANPTRGGYTFGGWYADSEFAVLWDFAMDTVTSVTTLYARWVSDLTITATAPTLASTTSDNNKAGTFAGVTVTHTNLTAANADRVKVFYTDDGSEPVIETASGIAMPGSAATKELLVHRYINSGTTQSVEWKIRDAVYGKTYNAIVSSLSGANKSAIRTWIHRPPTPQTKFESGAWKTGYLTNLFIHSYATGSTIYYSMGLAPVAADGTVTTANINTIPAPTTSSAVYNPATGIPLMDGRSETQAVVVRAIAGVEGYTTSVANFYYYNQDNLTMLTEARGKSEAEQLVIINKVIDSMTLTELTQMTGGASSNVNTLNTGAEGRAWGIARLGIPQNMLSDGPAGLRHKRLSTANMCWAGLASTWDVKAYEAAGELVGNEAIYYGVDIVLAPGLNIQRNPLGGRNFEYMSEDPLISGEAAAGYIRGIQGKGVGTAPKHFVANEQETNRNSGNTVASERALREIYFAPFERVVQDQPWTIMTSYNQLNGINTANDRWLLNEVARGEWGFKGYFMTDWGAVRTGSALIEAGNDMQQSGNSGSALRTWINGATGDEYTRRLELTKTAVRNILKTTVKTPSFIGTYDDLTPTIVNNRSYDFYTNPASPYAESREKNLEIASGGIVLMKNENNVLPRTTATKFALVSSSVARTASRTTARWADPGTVAVHDLVLQGGGSGHVYFADAITLKAGLEGIPGFSVPYAAVDTDIASSAQAEAAKAVAATDVGIMIFSRTTAEGADAPTTLFTLSNNEKATLEAFGTAFKAAGKPFICLINQGATMSTAEMNANADAILHVWTPGSQGAEAIAAIISGAVNPSGKLAQSFPITYTDSPSIMMGNPNRTPVNSWGTNPVFYDEGVFVGYRYFDAFGASRVAYRFGHGLSYTNFKFSDLTLSSDIFKDSDESITATVKVTNVGTVAGREVAQLYIGADKYLKEGRPVKELRDYAKTKLLQPGESEEFEFTIDKRDLQYFDDGEDPMNLPMLTGTAGTNTVYGASSVVYGKGKGWTVNNGTGFTVTIGGTSDSEILAQNGVNNEFVYVASADKYSVNSGEVITIPIKVNAGDGLAGGEGVVSYDSDILSLESIANANGFVFQSIGNKFIFVAPDGLNATGEVTVGYAVLKAKTVVDDVDTAVLFDITKGYNKDFATIYPQTASAIVTVLAEAPLRGDVNLDGEVNLVDAILLMQYVSGSVNLSSRQLKAADVSADGSVNVGDVIIIMQMCLN